MDEVQNVWSGDKYLGEWKDNKEHGRGVLQEAREAFVIGKLLCVFSRSWS